MLDGVRRVQDLIDQYNALMARWSEPDADYEAIGAEQTALEDRIHAVSAWDLERNVDIAMDALRCPPDDADVTTLSGGERRRVALCRLLLQHPDLLLLDEPTNHLDAESVEWLERFLEDYTGTVVRVTHDRYFLDDVARVDPRARPRAGHPLQGNYSGWLEQKLERMAREQKQADAKAADPRPGARMGAPVAQGPPGQGQGPIERLRAADGGSAGREDRRPGAGDRHPARAPARRAGDRRAGLRKGYGDRLLIEDLSFSLPRSGIVGIIGPNGAGKTTLFRMLVGEERPDAGSIEIGDTVALAMSTRVGTRSRPTGRCSRRSRRGTRSSRSARVRSRRAPMSPASTSVAPTSRSSPAQLSGGERNRVHLARLLRSGGNVLLLDEPTNDLDVDTLRALEAGLESFPGCAVVISHDRWFLDRIATHILAFEGDSQVRFFQGNVSDYEAFRHQELGAAADQPHRIRYKRLVA